MTPSVPRPGAPEWLIVAGSFLFTLILFISALFEADIRWLHFVQAWMYVACVALALRRNRWGYLIGISAGGLWDYLNLFVTTFLAAGARELSIWIGTGHLARPDLVIAVPAWIGNLLVVIGCVWAYRRHFHTARGTFARFVVAFALTTAFFAADIAVFQPRYLPLFGRLLHPHLPWATNPQAR
jgi:hypothetical protein